MNDEINYKNNPLHSIGLKKMLVELTDHYGFDILSAYLNVNCFKNNPSIASSVKFLKKTDWAREKVEDFYLYSFKNLPKATYQQSQLSPRDRIIPDDQTVGEPAELSLDEADQLRDEREKKAAEFDSKPGTGKSSSVYQNNRRPDTQDDDNTRDEEGDATGSFKRTASTADNPWGLPRE